MNSCLYTCEVMHHRLYPKRHHFQYRLFFCAFDLAELDLLPEQATFFTLFSHNRWNIYSFYDRDHLTLPGLEKASLRENLRTYLEQQNVMLPVDGRVMLITLPRILGYQFNPVSFYFCSDAQGAPLCSVAQVGNTFGEMKAYLLQDPPIDNLFRLVVPKHFYVSPFSSLDVSFDFQLKVPAERLTIRIDDLEENRLMLLTTLDGERAAFTQMRLLLFLFLYPLMTLQVIFFIHWEAFLLWMKGIAWFNKSANPERQIHVLRPHSTLTKPAKPAL